MATERFTVKQVQNGRFVELSLWEPGDPDGVMFTLNRQEAILLAAEIYSEMGML